MNFWIRDFLEIIYILCGFLYFCVQLYIINFNLIQKTYNPTYGINNFTGLEAIIPIGIFIAINVIFVILFIIRSFKTKIVFKIEVLNILCILFPFLFSLIVFSANRVFDVSLYYLNLEESISIVILFGFPVISSILMLVCLVSKYYSNTKRI